MMPTIRACMAHGGFGSDASVSTLGGDLATHSHRPPLACPSPGFSTVEANTEPSQQAMGARGDASGTLAGTLSLEWMLLEGLPLATVLALAADDARGDS